ncbi:cobalamin biosynthesis protein [Paenibacillus baekrokdamisoli]|uniref:Cobalamin biosynthesis protein n=1 Tax=Paenibacillus baekrokdamisoli TaxID=1712516 RepID=A0A3G9J456_9BACL|nr:CobW family GTP-binding protein [Paenibacillus baekrokdamisoli]MBB3072515.1 G3E family GTPase [Paenibacillus baekrokdamisoli]BBH20571.1 cobalamin biosynthesis protein [Paenibacillus baekrokdamisoli]
MRIPVLVLSGFLGSGKTTLLLRLLEEIASRGLKPGILMNELGKQDVDGRILGEHSPASLEKLLDGCICCSKKSEMAGSLSLLLKTKPDVIIIELTGVANPEEIADALTEPGLIGQLRLKRIITLLDAEHALDYNSIFATDKQLVRTLRRQLEVADFVIVNKTDLVKPAQLQKIEKAIRKQNEHASISYTTYSSLHLAPLLEGVTKREEIKEQAVQRLQMVKSISLKQKNAEGSVSSAPKHDHAESDRSFSRIQTLSLSWTTSARLTREQVERFLHRWKKELLRAKGYISFPNQGQMYLMQHAGKRTNWEPTAYTGEPYLVAIGIEFDQERFKLEWEQLT